MRTVIIIVSIIAIAATIGTIAVGMKSFEGIVVDNPYEAGLAWDEADRNKAALGWNVILRNSRYKTGMNELSLEALDKNGRQLENAVIRITTSRPSTRAYDKTYSTVKTPDKRFQASIDLPLLGAWDLKIDIIHNNKEHCSFNSRIYAEQQTARTPQQSSAENPDVIPCDIQHGACVMKTNDMTITFDILPKPVKAMSDLGYVITVKRNHALVAEESVELDLSMPGMYMGKNRPALKQLGQGTYQGTGIITRCTSGQKTWQAQVTVGRSSPATIARYQFEVQ